MTTNNSFIRVSGTGYAKVTGSGYARVIGKKEQPVAPPVNTSPIFAYIGSALTYNNQNLLVFSSTILGGGIPYSYFATAFSTNVMASTNNTRDFFTGVDLDLADFMMDSSVISGAHDGDGNLELNENLTDIYVDIDSTQSADMIPGDTYYILLYIIDDNGKEEIHVIPVVLPAHPLTVDYLTFDYQNNKYDYTANIGNIDDTTITTWYTFGLESNITFEQLSYVENFATTNYIHKGVTNSNFQLISDIESVYANIFSDVSGNIMANTHNYIYMFVKTENNQTHLIEIFNHLTPDDNPTFKNLLLNEKPSESETVNIKVTLDSNGKYVFEPMPHFSVGYTYLFDVSDSSVLNTHPLSFTNSFGVATPTDTIAFGSVVIFTPSVSESYFAYCQTHGFEMGENVNPIFVNKGDYLALTGNIEQTTNIEYFIVNFEEKPNVDDANIIDFISNYSSIQGLSYNQLLHHAINTAFSNIDSNIEKGINTEINNYTYIYAVDDFGNFTLANVEFIIDIFAPKIESFTITANVENFIVKANILETGNVSYYISVFSEQLNDSDSNIYNFLIENNQLHEANVDATNTLEIYGIVHQAYGNLDSNIMSDIESDTDYYVYMYVIDEHGNYNLSNIGVTSDDTEQPLLEDTIITAQGNAFLVEANVTDSGNVSYYISVFSEELDDTDANIGQYLIENSQFQHSNIDATNTLHIYGNVDKSFGNLESNISSNIHSDTEYFVYIYIIDEDGNYTLSNISVTSEDLTEPAVDNLTITSNNNQFLVDANITDSGNVSYYISVFSEQLNDTDANIGKYIIDNSQFQDSNVDASNTLHIYGNVDKSFGNLDSNIMSNIESDTDYFVYVYVIDENGNYSLANIEVTSKDYLQPEIEDLNVTKTFSTEVINVQVTVDANLKYVFDPVIDVYKAGNTYIFDQSDLSNDGHPLRFSETEGVFTPYNTMAVGNVVVLTPTESKTLYAYCTVHGFLMGSLLNPLSVDNGEGLDLTANIIDSNSTDYYIVSFEEKPLIDDSNIISFILNNSSIKGSNISYLDVPVTSAFSNIESNVEFYLSTEANNYIYLYVVDSDGNGTLEHVEYIINTPPIIRDLSIHGNVLGFSHSLNITANIEDNTGVSYYISTFENLPQANNETIYNYMINNSSIKGNLN